MEAQTILRQAANHLGNRATSRHSCEFSSVTLESCDDFFGSSLPLSQEQYYEPRHDSGQLRDTWRNSSCLAAIFEIAPEFTMTAHFDGPFPVSGSLRIAKSWRTISRKLGPPDAEVSKEVGAELGIPVKLREAPLRVYGVRLDRLRLFNCYD